MPKIGILYGTDSTVPSAVVDRINAKSISNLTAEHIRVGGVRIAQNCDFAVIIDRASQDSDFYRAYLRNAALNGTVVLNDPFHWTAHDKFMHYSLAQSLNIAVPRTVVLPHKSHPPGMTPNSLRNLMFPLNWEELFDYVGFPAFLKPLGRGAWLNVQRVETRDDFFNKYDQTGSICMLFQAAVDYTEHYRCYVIGDAVRVLRFQPNQPAHLRYVAEGSTARDLCDRLEREAKMLCDALHYEINAVEFAVKDGVPYVIDSFNPAPEADVHSVGQANFDWIVDHLVDLAVSRAKATTGRRVAAAT